MEDLLSLVEAAEVGFADRPAASDLRTTFSFAAVAERSRRFAHGIRALTGPGPANVALLTGNRAEAVENDIGLLKAGLGRVSLNPRLAPDEIAYIVRNSGSRVLIYDPAYADLLGELSDDPLTLVALDREGPGSYEHLLANASSSTARYPRSPDDASLIMYTSGTTGRPKGGVWSFATRAAGVRNMLLNELDANSARVMAHVGSISHGSGSKILPVYLRGGQSLLLSRFDPLEFFDLTRSRRITATFLVPTMIQMLLEAAPKDARTALASLSHAAYGGAKMPLPLIQQALDSLGECFVQVYGSCEAPHPVLFLNRTEHAERNPEVLNSSGRPVIGVDIRLGPDLELPALGAQGEILVRSPHVFAGYLNDPQATDQATLKGYYRTGDIGQVVADGVIEIVGRAKEMIISGGYNVYPAEVERVLLEHPGVAQACVYGVPDDRWGEMVCAAVIAAPGEAPHGDGIAQFCDGRLAAYKRPRSIHVVSSLPLGATNKVLRDEVRRLHLEGRLSG